MKSPEENGNLFLKQMSKLFEDLAAGQKEKPPISPRITCTRLRRLREIRCELVETTDPNMSILNDSDLEATVVQLNSARTKNESFASWVLRNKQAHQQFADRQNQLRQQGGNKNEQGADTNNAFANFSPAALQKVAKNHNTPASTLKWLAAHYRADIRQAVAENISAGDEIMTALAVDVDEAVRIILVGNKSLPRDLLLKLCDDPSPLVSEKAKNVLYTQSKLAITSSHDNKIADKRIDPTEFAADTSAKPAASEFPLISSENAICETNSSLKSGRKNTVRSALIEQEFLQVIAEKATTPPRRLAELAKHSDQVIRCLVAANPNSTPEILWQLAKDESINVRRKLLSNYNCPEEIIEFLMHK